MHTDPGVLSTLRGRLPLSAAAVLFAVTAACATDSAGGLGGESSTRTGPWWQCPPTKGAAAGQHGQACISGADCAYGHCIFGAFLAGYDSSVGFCTKNSACDAPGSNVTAPCSVDDGGGIAFTSVFEKSKSGGNTARITAEPLKLCARTCTNDAACQAWNAAMPHCIKNSTAYVSAGAVGSCGKDPFRR